MESIDNATSANIEESRSMENLIHTSNIALKYTPFVEEIRISSIVLRRGYLNFFEEKDADWVKKFIVRRINMFHHEIKKHEETTS